MWHSRQATVRCLPTSGKLVRSWDSTVPCWPVCEGLAAAPAFSCPRPGPAPRTRRSGMINAPARAIIGAGFVRKWLMASSPTPVDQPDEQEVLVAAGPQESAVFDRSREVPGETDEGPERDILVIGDGDGQRLSRDRIEPQPPERVGKAGVHRESPH